MYTFTNFITKNNSNIPCQIAFLCRLTANDELRLNVKNMSSKRSIKILQPEKKTEMKRSFCLFRDTIFSFLRRQSIAFVL